RRARARLGRDRGALRQDRPRSPDPGRRIARRRPRLPRRTPGRQGDLHDVVADLEEADRAGHRHEPSRGERHEAAHGDDGRGGAAPGHCDRRSDAVLQPCAQDRHASLDRMTMDRDADRSLRALVESYDPSAPLERAWTIPASWYVDSRIAELENRTTFRRTWQLVARTDQIA